MQKLDLACSILEIMRDPDVYIDVIDKLLFNFSTEELQNILSNLQKKVEV